MVRRATLLGLIAGLTAAVPAIAQTDPADCSGIKDNTARLKCYDASAGSGWPSTPNWSGTGEKSLPPFSVSGPWTLHWSGTADDGVSIFVYPDPGPSGGNYVDSPSTNSAGSDQSYETTTGNIYLKVVADGPWKVWVTAGS